MSWMIGMPMIMAKVSRSRRIWMTSLIITARDARRARSARGFMAASPVASGEIVRRLVHQADEDVLEAGGVRRRRWRRFRRSPRGRSRSSRAGSEPTTWRSLPKGATCSTPSQPAERCARIAPASPPLTTKVCRPDGGDHLGHGAARDDPAVGDVDDAVAALGLVHVVGGDEHGQPVGGELVDLVPELAPRLRVDAGGRLVEKQELRLVHDAGGEREPLLPAAGERAGELVLAVGEAEAARASRRRMPGARLRS